MLTGGHAVMSPGPSPKISVDRFGLFESELISVRFYSSTMSALK